MSRILCSLGEITSSDSVVFRALQSLTGKLMDVKFLVPGGRFNLLFFLQGIQLDLGKGDMVVISEDQTWNLSRPSRPAVV